MGLLPRMLSEAHSSGTDVGVLPTLGFTVTSLALGLVCMPQLNSPFRVVLLGARRKVMPLTLLFLAPSAHLFVLCYSQVVGLLPGFLSSHEEDCAWIAVQTGVICERQLGKHLTRLLPLHVPGLIFSTKSICRISTIPSDT